MEIIANPLKYLIPIWLAIIILLMLFKFNNWVDSRPVKKDTKSKEETIKKIDKPSEDSLAVSRERAVEPVPDIVVTNNYLYDRFVDNPTAEDNVDNNKMRQNVFLTDEESSSIRNNKVKIEVKPVENLTEKEILYNKIEEMTNENAVNREKLLEEFDSLPRTTRLMLIEHIIQKMN